MALKNNTWKLNQWYDQAVAGNVSYTGPSSDWNKLYFWGFSGQGNAANNATSPTYFSSPVQIAGSWKQYSQGAQNGGGIKTDGTRWAWGANDYGGLGLNDILYRSSPTQVPGTWAGLNHAIYNTYAVNTDGELWVQGYNNSGCLGQGNETKYSSPVQVPGTTWSGAIGHITGGYNTTGAIKTNGTLWMWGRNENGQLGHNNLTELNSPVQVPGTNWSYIKTNYDSCFAIKTDGTLWAWGQNRDGCYGNNTADGTRVSSPIQIPGTTWKSIAGTFGRNTAATKTDGTLWTWGGSHYGALGQNSPDDTKRSSPVQIPGTTWDIVRANSNKYLATKTDGTLWGWGRNQGGQIGANTAQTVSSPIQVPGADWNITNLNSGAYNGSFGAGFKL